MLPLEVRRLHEYRIRREGKEATTSLLVINMSGYSHEVLVRGE